MKPIFYSIILDVLYEVFTVRQYNSGSVHGESGLHLLSSCQQPEGKAGPVFGDRDRYFENTSQNYCRDAGGVDVSVYDVGFITPFK